MIVPKKDDVVLDDPVITIELDGEKFSFPRDQDDWPTGAIVAAGRVSAGRAQYDDVVEKLLGEEQWNRLSLMSFRQFKEFLKLFSEAMDGIKTSD